jgi:hypothetical protein
MSERGDKEAVVDTPEKGAAVEEDLSVRMESVKVVKAVVLILSTVKQGKCRHSRIMSSLSFGLQFIKN